MRHSSRLLVLAACDVGLAIGSLTAHAQFSSGQEASAFTGAWCAQGDANKHASIASNGAFLTLTNETGDTSPGQLQGKSGIIAPGWQFVSGTLSGDASQINWSNGTYWTRCNTGRGRAHYKLNLTGTWYAQGNRSQSCSIQQNGKSLQLTNESGATATGQVTRKRQLSSNWNGTTIGATVTPDADRIDWTNGTYWTRTRLFGRQTDSRRETSTH